MQDLRIVYPKGDLTTLSVATVRDYEADTCWKLASTRRFGLNEEDEAWEYAYELADRNGLQVYDDRPGQHNFLD